MKPTARLRDYLSIAGVAVLTISCAQALTYTWDSTNVTGTPAANLNWFSGGTWIGGAPVSASDTIIKFFADTSTSLPNTALPSTQTVNLNNGGSAFQLGTLELNGFGSATSGASLTMTLQGDALNFSGATGTISFNSVKNVAPASDTVINYTVNNNIQLGTASSASVLTLTGNGDNAGTTTYLIGGSISELQAGGGSLLKSGTSLVTVSGAINFTGGITVSAGTLTLSNNTNTASAMTVNGGSLILTGNLNPASGSMTVNSGGILQIGNNTATQFGPSGVYSGNISTGTGGTLQLRSTSTQELSGIISGSGGINKGRSGTLTLSGANTYTGKSQFQPLSNGASFTVNVSSFDYVTSGTWANHGLGSSLGAPTTVANGTIDIGGVAQAGVTLNYTGAGETTDRVLAVAWNGNSSQTIQASGSGLLNFTSPFTLASSGGSGSLILTGAGNGQVAGMTGQLNTTGLSKTGTGTWTISGATNFAQPTTITGGILNLASTTALQNSPFDTTASSLGTGTLGFKITTTTLTLGGLTGANPLKGRFTTALGGPSNATANGGYAGLTNLTLNTAAGSNSAYTGAIVEGATGMTLTKTGAGIQSLGLGNTYTGTTSVNGGLLTLNGNTLTGGLSVSGGHFASNSSFAGVSSVTAGGVISPGASFGAIGTLTLTNATASALTLNGGTGVFDLPSTVTTPDQIAVTGGLVVSGTNTALLRTSQTGTPAGVYNLITSSGTTGAGSFVLANGSATRGNATISTSGGNVILTVAAGGLAGTSTYTGTSGAFNSDRWNITTNWNSGVVPTGTTNVVLPDQTAAFNVPVLNVAPPTYSGDLWIGNNVTLQIGSTGGNAAFNNALGTPGSTIIYMGQNSAISSRNSGFNPTMPQIILLGDASMRFQESTQVKVDPNFAHSISGAFTLSLTSGNGNGFSTHTLNAANSFAGLNLAGTAGVVNADVSGSIGTANLSIGGGGTVNLNHATALADGSNPILINNGTLAYGTTSAAPLTLSTRAIQLNGTGQATINNNNTAGSSANILTLAGGISSTAAGAKTLTLGGTNVGLNLVSTNLTDGTGGGTLSLAKNGAGTWQVSGNNSYTGTTGVSNGTLIMSGNNTLAGQITVSGASGATLTLSGNNSGMSGNVVLSTSFPTTAGSSPLLNINSATALGTGTLIFGGGAATDTVRIDNTSLVAVNVSTANAITMNRDFTFVGTRDLNLGTGAVDLNTTGTALTRNITTTASTLTLGGALGNSGAGVTGITKAGVNGTLVLSNTNTYTGITTASAGTLIAGSSSPSGSAGAFGNASSEIGLGTASSNNNASILIGGAFDVGRVIRLATANTTDAGTRVLTLGGNTAHNSVFSGNIILGTASQAGRGVTLTAASGGQVTFSGVIQNPGSMDATIYTVTKAGAGTVVLSNANLYTGSTAVTNGVLKLDHATALPGGIGVSGGTNNLTINGGGIVGLTGNTASFLRGLGAGATQVQFTGSGGFAAYGGDRTVNLGNAGATAQWGSGSFVTGGSSLILSAADADGTLIWANPINFAGSVRTIQVNNGSAAVDARLTAALGVSGGANGGLDKTGLGTLQTTADNIYVGATTITAGTLELGNNASTGRLSATSSISVASGATLSINRSNAFSQATDLGAGVAITGDGGFTQAGGGTTTLTATNTYTGATTISNGTLLINGSTAAGSTVSVSSGATLGGTGTIGGAVNVTGSLSPGASIETLDSGTLSFANGSTLIHELNSSVATSVGSDLMKVTGNLNLVGTVGLSLSDLAVTDVAFNVNDVFSLINYTGTWNNGLFTFSGNELADEEVFTFGLNSWKISYDDSTGGLNYTGEYAGGADSFVNITVVPEPRAALLGALGALMLLRRRRINQAGTDLRAVRVCDRR